MAVHTPLQATEIAAFLEAAGLEGAHLEASEGVAEGSIHTTYRLRHAGRTRYLRRYEGTPIGEVEYELALLRHLAPRLAAGVAEPLHLPEVVVHRDGRLFRELAGAPAALFEAVPGGPRQPATLGPPELRSLGALLARLHLASAGFAGRRSNPYGGATVEGWLRALEAEAPGGEVGEALPRIRRALERGREAVTLPAGEAPLVGHGDLFPDNLHWEGGRITGVLDFEMACDLPREWDLAVGLLIFCWTDAGPDAAGARALLEGYGRAPGADPDRLRGALHFVAARYALSRIRDFARSPLAGDRLVQKDWRELDRCLRHLEAIGAEFWDALHPR
ncbi:MAG: phosphotransferase [Deltaproteobacteria bacterium]|nr:phosphotransferase [Deltaproteobacteria bacterium]